MGLGRREAERAGLGRGTRRWRWLEDRAGGSSPPVRYQSTAESRTHVRITAQGLASREASRCGLFPTSAPAQGLPISPPQSGANRRGAAPLPVLRYSGADAQESARARSGASRTGAGAGARWAPSAGGERPALSRARGCPRASASRLTPGVIFRVLSVT